MTYEEAKAIRDRLTAELDAETATLRAIPGHGTGSCGLTPDVVKETAAYQVAKSNTNNAFRKLQDFNVVFVRCFRKEIRNERHRAVWSTGSLSWPSELANQRDGKPT